jgi:hypothetical protein
MEKGIPIGVFDCDGREICLGDKLKPVRGWNTHEKFNKMGAEVVYTPPFFALKWDDGYVNPGPIAEPRNWQVIP